MFEDFKPIAVRDDRNGTTVISYDQKTKKFLVSVSGEILERPLTLKEIEVLRDNFNDILEMKGRYLFIKEYDILGSQNE